MLFRASHSQYYTKSLWGCYATYVFYIRHLWWNCHYYALCKMGFSDMLQNPPKCTNMFFWQYLPILFHAEINWPSSLRIARSVCFIIGIYDEGWLFVRHASMCWNIIGPTHIYLNPDECCWALNLNLKWSNDDLLFGLLVRVKQQRTQCSGLMKQKNTDESGYYISTIVHQVNLLIVILYPLLYLLYFCNNYEAVVKKNETLIWSSFTN